MNTKIFCRHLQMTPLFKKLKILISICGQTKTYKYTEQVFQRSILCSKTHV